MMPSATTNTATDPVCGMSVDPQTARSAEHDGESFYFCSQSCLTKFQNDPQAVLAKAAERTQKKSDHSCCSHDTPKGEAASVSGSIYTCPMHPEVEQTGPGSCPICGMDLEPKVVDANDTAGDEQLQDMTRRFWVGALLSMPLLVIAMGPMIGWSIDRLISATAAGWLQLLLATPVVFWSGWPLLVRGFRSFQSLNLNMFSLIAVGTLAA